MGKTEVLNTIDEQIDILRVVLNLLEMVGRHIMS